MMRSYNYQHLHHQQQNIHHTHPPMEIVDQKEGKACSRSGLGTSQLDSTTSTAKPTIKNEPSWVLPDEEKQEIMRTMEECLAQMNQDALDLLFEGREMYAKDMLHQCLALSQQQQQKNASSFQGSSRSSISPTTIPLMGALGGYEDEWSGFQGRYFALYRQIFTINSIGPHIWDSATHALFRDMVCYNLATVYHHEAITEEGEVVSLGMARVLYYASMDAYTKSRVMATDTGYILFGLALYNNLGYFHAQIGDQEGVIQCRGLLQAALLRYPTDNVLDSDTEAFFRRSIAW